MENFEPPAGSPHAGFGAPAPAVPAAPPPGTPSPLTDEQKKLLAPWTLTSAVVDRTKASLKHSYTPLLLVSALCTIPSAVQLLLTALQVPSIVGTLVGVVGAILGIVQVGAMFQGAATALNGGAVHPGEVLRVGYQRGVPVFLASLLVGLATITGFMLCVFPGFYVVAMLSGALPAVIVEGSDVLPALTRSRNLTRGVLSAVFNVVFIAGFLSVLAAVPAFVGGAYAGFGPSAAGETNTQHLAINAAAGALSLALGILVAPVTNTMLVALFFRLREVREGNRVDQLAQVFT